MDRDDARFVIGALESRLAGDRAELDRLAASSLVRLYAAAAKIKQVIGRADPLDPIGHSAHLCALELEAICRGGGAAVDGIVDPTLNIFVDKLRELAAEPVRPILPRNRFERRSRVSGKALARQRREHLRQLGQQAPA